MPKALGLTGDFDAMANISASFGFSAFALKPQIGL